MNLPTQLERDLFDSLSREHQAEVEEHYAALESEDADESANEDIDLGQEAIDLMVRPDPVLDEDEDGTPGERLARDAYGMLEPYDYINDR